MIFSVLAVTICACIIIGYMIYSILDGIRYHEEMRGKHKDE